MAVRSEAPGGVSVLQLVEHDPRRMYVAVDGDPRRHCNEQQTGYSDGSREVPLA